MASEHYDVLVIGGGTAGLVAAKRAAGGRRKVAIVERDRLGGECLWTGCIPAKTLLNSASVYRTIQKAQDYGLPADNEPLNWPDVVRAKDEVVARIAREDGEKALASADVAFLRGSAAFLSQHEVLVQGGVLTADQVVVATGSRQAEPRGLPGLLEAGYITHVQAVSLPLLPRRLAVIGAGPVGVEFAQLFSRLGSRVTLLERSDQILSQEDPEIAHYLERLLREEGLSIVHGCTVQAARATRSGKVLEIRREDRDEELLVDEILLATGRAPNVEQLNLAAAGVETDQRGIKVDYYLRTSAPNIYACGDVSGEFLFSHVAEYQARLVAQNILLPGAPRMADYSVVPWATFSDPEVGHVGLTESQALAAGHSIKVERFLLANLDRALTLRQGRGLVKVIAEAHSGRILGAHIVGPGASNIIHEYVLAMRAGIPLPEIADTIHAYPTLSEAVREAAAKF